LFVEEPLFIGGWVGHKECRTKFSSHSDSHSNHKGEGYVRIVDSLGTDLSVVNAARVSYLKESDNLNEKDERLINFLWSGDHSSPFRHAVISFEIHAPLLVARQWWKYVVSSSHIDDQNGWNESSRRYVTESPKFYIPDTWRSAPENLKQGSGEDLSLEQGRKLNENLLNYIETGVKLYESALEEGIAPEQARLFLPAYGMYVRWRWTASLQSIIHFLKQRLQDDAQKEIQVYAKTVFELSRELFPATFRVAFDG
jgi:thymidylate synthase (FAD)